MNKLNQLCAAAVLPFALMGTAQAAFVFDGEIESDGWGTTHDLLFFDVAQSGNIDFTMSGLSGNLSPTFYLYEQGVGGVIDYDWDGWNASMSSFLNAGSYLLVAGDSTLWDNDFSAASSGGGWGAYQISVNGASVLTNIYEGNLNGAFTMTTPTAVPVPAAVWLFGSGLVGLAGFARRKAA
jgi:hypothetical protein